MPDGSQAMPTPAMVATPTRRRLGLKSRLSRMRALIQTAFGQTRGFFIQYPYYEHLQPVAESYPEVEALCREAPFYDFLREIESCRETVRHFKGTSDPVLGRGMFPALDGMAAYTAVRHFKPRRIIEIGCGDSTYFLARAVHDNGFGHITCIDPQPRRDIIALDLDFRPRLLKNYDADLAETLEAGDILFIDSSHIMLPGMDVDIQLNRLFPRLKPGVAVHVHDIFLPDDYPPHWRIRNYSEQNALIGWIVSGYFKILWPGHYVFTRARAEVEAAVGDPTKIFSAGSLWLIRTG